MKKSEFLSIVKAQVKEAIKPFKEAQIRKSVNNSPEEVTITKNEHLSIAKYIKGAITGVWGGAELEEQSFVSINKAVLRGGLGTLGGFLIPPEISAEIIELLRAKAVIRKMGATIYPMTSDTLELPRVTGGATAYWVADASTGTDITPSDESFGVLELVLRECAAVVKVKNTLIQDASPAVDKIVMEDMTKVLALAEDLAFIQGTGGSQPLGVYRDPDVSTTTLGGGNGAVPSFDDLMDAMYQIESNNGEYDGWIAHPRAKNTLRQRKDGNGNYIYHIGGMSRDLSVKEPDNLLGEKVGLTTQVPVNLAFGTGTSLSYIILGLWSDFAIGQKVGSLIEIRASQEAGDSFLRNQTFFRAIQRVDGAARNPNNFYIIKGVSS